MRAVNLLPVGERARGPAKVPDRASHIVLGVLGALVLAVLVVVMTQNQITDRTKRIADAKQEQQQAEQRSASLGAFGEFAAIKQTRVKSVGELAKARFDYERLMRELALVLPKETWITTAVAASTATAAAGGAKPTSAAPAGTSAAPAAHAGPSLKLGGCAKTQAKVAETMVRLRNLHRAEDVTLEDSARPVKQAATGAASSSSTGGGGDGCGSDFAFNVTVTFTADTGETEARDKSTPATLGGGS